MRSILIGLVMLTACGGDKPAAPVAWGEPATRTISAGALDSLPRLIVSDGQLVCLSDGQKPCPVAMAMANWLDNGRYATWEAHRPIQLWTPGVVDPVLLGSVGTGDSLYEFPVAVAKSGTGMIVLSAAGAHALRYNANGKFTSSIPFPALSITHATGFQGSIPFYQVIRERGADSGALFELREIETPGDTSGVLMFKQDLDWLRVQGARPVAPLPLYPILPSYMIAADSDVVWGSGQLFALERRARSGTLRWSLTSDATGPAVTKEEVAEARAKLPLDAAKGAWAHFDSSVAITGKFHPAIGAIILAKDGRVLVVGVPVSSLDSVKYVTLSRMGEPTGQFLLPRVNRVLLFAGDSVLVQRPGANAQPELRWVVTKAPAKP